MIDRYQDTPNVRFTVASVQKLRKKLKPGDIVNFREPVTRNEESGGQSHGKYITRTGIILRRFPHLALIERMDSSRTTVTYVELLLMRKRKRR